MNPIGSFSGLASGIQWRDMIDQIMRLEATRKVRPLTSRVSVQEARVNAWNTFQGLVSKLKSASSALKDGSAFGQFTATATTGPSGRALISASASTSAAPGNYKVEVAELAKAAKVSGSAVADAAAALNLSGQFFVNGRAVDIATGDSLNAIRDKINAVNSGTNPSGVTATILSTSATSHSLVLTSDQTGSRGIELVDSGGAGGVLTSLGVLSGSTTANTAPTDIGKTQTQRFNSTSTSIASMLGVTAPPTTTTIEVDGKKITVDLTTDTLLTLQNKIATAGGSSTIEQETVGGRTLNRLSVQGTVKADAAATDPAASQRIVELLGFSKETYSSEITAGTDARFRIDGFNMTRRTNTVTDAIAGVTLNLLASDAAQRTSSLLNPVTGLSIGTDPKTIDPGTYAIQMATSTQRTTSASVASLSVLAAPSTTQAGTYDVNITQAATRSSVTGTVANATYSGTTGDTMTITDHVTGVTQSYSLTNGQTLSSVVAGLNNMFTANGMKMTAVDNGGYLKLEHADYGSAAAFTVKNSHNNVGKNYGVGDTLGIKYQNGLNVAGTIGGQAATGVGQVLTGNAGTAVEGLQVQYTGTTTGSPVGSVTVTDTTVVSGVTVGGVAAVWHDATKTIRGAVGSKYEGLVLNHTGALQTGKLGDLVVEGDIAVDLAIARDADATVQKVQDFAAAYTEMANFVKSQRETQGPLAMNASLRSAKSTLTDVLLTPQALTSAYTQGAQVGVALTREGTLEVDATKLKAALEANPNDVEALFAGIGGSMYTQADGIDHSGDGLVATQVESLQSSIDRLNSRVTEAERRLEIRREGLVRQFTAMEESLGKIQSQGSWLFSQLSSLQGYQ